MLDKNQDEESREKQRENPEAEAQAEGRVTESLGGGNLRSGLGAQLGRGGTLTERAGASRNVTIGGAVGEGSDESVTEPIAEFIDIMNYLRDLRFPATKDQIVSHAREQGAPGDVMDILKQIPDGEYLRTIDVIPEINEIRGVL